jgi:hypothetical protein
LAGAFGATCALSPVFLVELSARCDSKTIEKVSAAALRCRTTGNMKKLTFWQSSCDASVHPYRSASPCLDRGAEGAAAENLAEPEYEGVVVA